MADMYGFVYFHLGSLFEYHGKVAKSLEDKLENPYLDNTPELIAARKARADAELTAKEQANLDEFTERLVLELKKPQVLDDLNTAVHSEVDYHKRREQAFRDACK